MGHRVNTKNLFFWWTPRRKQSIFSRRPGASTGSKPAPYKNANGAHGERMAVKWHERFVTVREKNGGNLVLVSGAFAMLVSLALPWYYVEYRLSHSGIEGLRILLEFIAGNPVSTILPALAAAFLGLNALYILVSARAERALPLAVITAILVTAAILSLPVSPEHYGPGLYCAAAGLFATAAGALAKR